jgi:multiple RNA-binding domain-containing protein 1
MEDNVEINKSDDIEEEVSSNIKRGRVFIRNLPFTITEDKLKKEFEKFGEITEVDIYLC